MDPLGAIARNFLKEAHARNVRNAVSLATELRREEKMTNEQDPEKLQKLGNTLTGLLENLERTRKIKKS